MRSPPILLAILFGAIGIGLGLRVMLRSSTNAAPVEGGPEGTVYLGGVPQGHVYTGCAEEPGNVNPFTTHEAVARRLVLAYTHDSLLDGDPATGKLRPSLAESFEIAPDGSTCTFTLRAGVRFADGSPLTMADVLFGWELARAGHVTFGFIGDAYGRVAEVEELDARRFRVRFRDVHYAATQVVGEAWLVAQRQFFVDRVAERARLAGEAPPAVDTERFARLLEQVVAECGPGTGPYMLQNRPEGPSTWRRRQDLLVVRNPHSWRRELEPGCWNFAGLRILFRDPQNVLNALVRGELDWFSGTALDELVASRPELLRTYRQCRYDYPSLGPVRLVWNCRRKPFDDARVRRALAMLFDVDAMLAVFGRDGAKPARAHAKLGSPEYPADVQPIAYSPAEARRLLRDCGFDADLGKPLRLVLLSPQGLDALRRLVDLFVGAAKQAGIDVELRSPPFTALVPEKKRGDWDGLLVLQSLRPWGDPYEFVHSAGTDNEGHWQNAEADRLASTARTELDAGKRAELLRQLHTLVYEEQPVSFLVQPFASILLNVNIRNLEPGPLGLVPERAWVAPEHQRR